MDNCVMDASIFVKAFIRESDSVSARVFIDKILLEGNITAPSLLEYELFRVLITNKFDMGLAMDRLNLYKSTSLKLVNLEREIIEQAKDIVNTGNKSTGYPRFYDAIYHSVAISYKCHFITADRKYYNKVKEIGNIKLFSEITDLPSA